MPTPAAQTPPRFSLRPAAPPDETFRLRLYASTRAEEIALCAWAPARREEFIRSQFRARQTDYAARFPEAQSLIIVVADTEAGAAMLWRSPTELRLIAIELLPAFRRQGLGSALLQRWIEEAAVGRIPLTLHVREDNLGAARLYRRLGFKIHARVGAYLAMRREP